MGPARRLRLVYAHLGRLAEARAPSSFAEGCGGLEQSSAGPLTAAQAIPPPQPPPSQPLQAGLLFVDSDSRSHTTHACYPWPPI